MFSMFTNTFFVFDGNNGKMARSIEDLEGSIQQRIYLSNPLTIENKSLILAIRHLQNLNFLSINIFSRVNKIVHEQLHYLATALASNTSLTSLEIDLEYYAISKSSIRPLLICLKPIHLTSLRLRFFEISDILLESLASGISKLENLTTFKLKIGTKKEKGEAKEILFRSLKSLQQLRVLKVNIMNQSYESQATTTSEQINIILPECQQLKLGIEDVQFFSSFKEFRNLTSLNVKLSKTPSLFLSQIAERQLPNLLSVVNLTLKFAYGTAEQMIEFSCKAIESLVNLKSLKLVLSSIPSTIFTSLLSSIRKQKTIETLFIHLRGSTTIYFSEIDVNHFVNIRNLVIDCSKCYFSTTKWNEIFVKKLRNLNYLFTLKTQSFSSKIKQIKKSKRLVRVELH